MNDLTIICIYFLFLKPSTYLPYCNYVLRILHQMVSRKGVCSTILTLVPNCEEVSHTQIYKLGIVGSIPVQGLLNVMPR